jgi:hypothetical protein
MTLAVTDLLALVIVGLAAWKVVCVVRTRLRLPAERREELASRVVSQSPGYRCKGCQQCPGRSLRR